MTSQQALLCDNRTSCSGIPLDDNDTQELQQERGLPNTAVPSD